MNQQRSGLAIASLGVASLAVAGTCLVFVESLGWLSYVGATLAIFLAMVCATRFGAPQQPAAPMPQAAAVPVRKPRKEARKDARCHAASAREDSEDELIESRMAALHAAVEVEDAPSTLPPQYYEPASCFAPPELASASSFVVVEESLDPALAQQFAQLQPEPAFQAEVPTSIPLRQMDDIRAQIARLREESRQRHAAHAARNQASRAEGTVASPQSRILDESASEADPFARTEFSGLPGAQRTSFARTEFLAPVKSSR